MVGVSITLFSNTAVASLGNGAPVHNPLRPVNKARPTASTSILLCEQRRRRGDAAEGERWAVQNIQRVILLHVIDHPAAREPFRHERYPQGVHACK